MKQGLWFNSGTFVQKKYFIAPQLLVLILKTFRYKKQLFQTSFKIGVHSTEYFKHLERFCKMIESIIDDLKNKAGFITKPL